MTFSARMRYDASFLEYKVRPNIIRNVRTLYYKLLSWDFFSKIKSHIVEKLTWKINPNVPDKLPYGTTIYHVSKEFGWVV